MGKENIGGGAGKPGEKLGKAVRDIMHRGVPTCHPDTPLADVVRQMASGRNDAVAVVDEDGDVVGLITDLDVVQRYTDDVAQVRAEQVMRPKANVVAPDTLVIEAVHIMLDRGVRHLLIKGAERREVPVGILSAVDVVRDMAGLERERPIPKARDKKK